MPIFEYKAFDRTGAPKAGIVDADTPREARVKLRADGVHVVEIWPIEERKAGTAKRKFSLFQKRVNMSELTIVTRQLGTLLKAGIPVVDALKAMIDQVDSRDFEQVFRDVREKVTQGETLGEALAHHPAYFSDLYVNMVKAGEASGHLDEILARLAIYLTKVNRLRNKIISALTYPVLMVVVGTVVVIVLMTTVVPNLTGVFAKLGKALPATTEALIAISGFLQRYWWSLLVVVGLIYLFRKVMIATEDGRLRYDRMMMRLPAIGDVIRKNAINRFATTTAILIRSGIPVLEALRIVQKVVQNSVIAKTLGEVHDAIVEGSDISTPLIASNVFPSMVGYMIATGEQSGQLEEILERVADSYEEEVELASQRMTSVLEPVIIIGLAVIVLFVVLAIVTPLLRMGAFAN